MSIRKALAALTIAGATAAGAVIAPPAGAVYAPDGQTVLIGGTKVVSSGSVSGYDDFEWSGPRRLR